MKRSYSFFVVALLCLSLTFFLMNPDAAFAGIGGAFAKGAAKSGFGRIFGILFAIAAIILVPLVIYVTLAESRGSKKAKDTLDELAHDFPIFSWQALHERIENILTRLHTVWSSGDLSQEEDLFVPRYFHSQQEMLNHWNQEGKVNHLELKKIKRIRPLKIHTGSVAERPHVICQIHIDVIDYLTDGSLRVLKGSKKKETVEQLWRMELYQGNWCLGAVEPSDNSLVFAQEANVIDRDHLFSYMGDSQAKGPVHAEVEEEDDAASQESDA